MPAFVRREDGTQRSQRRLMNLVNAVPSVIAGKPSADGSQPLGKKGRTVKVAMQEKHEPIVPKIPSCLFQNPSSNNLMKDLVPLAASFYLLKQDLLIAESARDSYASPADVAFVRKQN